MILRHLFEQEQEQKENNQSNNTKSKLLSLFQSKKTPKYKYKRVPIEGTGPKFGNITIPKKALIAPAAIAAALYL